MATPFDTAFKPDPITDAQRTFLRRLTVDKAGRGGDQRTDAEIDAWLDTLSKRDASHQIDETLVYLRDTAAAARAVKEPEDIEDGFYALPDGRIAKVIHAVYGSGRQYAKKFNPETGKFDMAPRLLRDVKAAGKRIDTDQALAAELGKLYGVCMCCGLTLTDDTSIERGIGPVCLSKRGW